MSHVHDVAEPPYITAIVHISQLETKSIWTVLYYLFRTQQLLVLLTIIRYYCMTTFQYLTLKRTHGVSRPPVIGSYLQI